MKKCKASKKVGRFWTSNILPALIDFSNSARPNKKVTSYNKTIILISVLLLKFGALAKQAKTLRSHIVTFKVQIQQGKTVSKKWIMLSFPYFPFWLLFYQWFHNGSLSWDRPQILPFASSSPVPQNVLMNHQAIKDIPQSKLQIPQSKISNCLHLRQNIRYRMRQALLIQTTILEEYVGLRYLKTKM